MRRRAVWRPDATRADVHRFRVSGRRRALAVASGLSGWAGVARAPPDSSACKHAYHFQAKPSLPPSLPPLPPSTSPSFPPSPPHPSLSLFLSLSLTRSFFLALQRMTCNYSSRKHSSNSAVHAQQAQQVRARTQGRDKGERDAHRGAALETQLNPAPNISSFGARVCRCATERTSSSAMPVMTPMPWRRRR